MSKKEISWIGLINALIAERKKAGKPAGVKDVMGDAKKQWVEIKAGKDPKYVKGKQVITRKKGKKSKKSKKSHKVETVFIVMCRNLELSPFSG